MHCERRGSEVGRGTVGAADLQFAELARSGVSEALLTGHAAGFSGGARVGVPVFGGVFGQVRYDNAKSAVKEMILRRYQPEEAAGYIAFRSYWSFTAEFCNLWCENKE